jgi:pilus assembly protein CpaF
MYTGLENPYYEDVLHLLGDLAQYIKDPSISEVMVNPNRTIFIERHGRKVQIESSVSVSNLIAAAHRIARHNHDELSEERPIFNGRFGDGSSRVCIVQPPASPDGVMWSIRKFPKTRLSAEDLIGYGSITRELYQHLRAAVAARETILLSGGPGTGKTTLLQILAADIEADDRIALIEKPSEIQMDHANVFRLEANDESKISMKVLIETVLRLLPNRVIFGEVRGGEAADLLEVLNTGHPGSFTTIHANSAMLALSRLTTLALRGDAGYIPTRRIIGDVVRHVVHLRVMPSGQRKVSEVIRVRGYIAAKDEFDIEQIS